MNRTATIEVYTPFLANGLIAEIKYRGKVLHSFIGRDAIDIMSKAQSWCEGRGFAKTKVIIYRDMN